MSLHRISRSYSTVPSIQANQQIFSTGAKHLKYSDRPLDERLTSAAVRFTSFPGLLRSRFLVYHACLVLDKCPCFTLAQSFRGYREKRWTDTRTHPVYTHIQTHYGNPRRACAQARVNYDGRCCGKWTHFVSMLVSPP